MAVISGLGPWVAQFTTYAHIPLVALMFYYGWLTAVGGTHGQRNKAEFAADRAGAALDFAKHHGSKLLGPGRGQRVKTAEQKALLSEYIAEEKEYKITQDVLKKVLALEGEVQKVQAPAGAGRNHGAECERLQSMFATVHDEADDVLDQWKKVSKFTRRQYQKMNDMTKAIGQAVKRVQGDKRAAEDDVAQIGILEKRILSLHDQTKTVVEQFLKELDAQAAHADEAVRAGHAGVGGFNFGVAKPHTDQINLSEVVDLAQRMVELQGGSDGALVQLKAIEAIIQKY